MEKFITFILIGIILLVCGILNIRGNISTIHSYNRRKVVKADIPKYGKCMGIGSLIIGFSFVVCAVFELAFKTDIIEHLVVLGTIIGLVIMLYGQFKYNKGIF